MTSDEYVDYLKNGRIPLGSWFSFKEYNPNAALQEVTRLILTGSLPLGYDLILERQRKIKLVWKL